MRRERQQGAGTALSRNGTKMRRDYLFNETVDGHILFSFSHRNIHTVCAYGLACCGHKGQRQTCSVPSKAFPSRSSVLVPPLKKCTESYQASGEGPAAWDCRIERPEFWSAYTPQFRHEDNMASITSAVDCTSSASMGKNERRLKGISSRQLVMAESCLKRRRGSFSQSSAGTARTAVLPSPR